MQAIERLSLEQIRALLEASDEVGFKGQNQEEVYRWVGHTLLEQGYHELKRDSRGLVRRYLEKMTGLSRAQITRLVTMYLAGNPVQLKVYRRKRFPERYSRQDIVLLAALDDAHDTISGPAAQKLLQRACYDFQDSAYSRLAQLSVAQLYRLRKSSTYRRQRVAYRRTKPAQVAIGERRRPEPENRPGYLRVDTVHQGDLNGVKGVFHINAVDEVTQWQIVGACEHISEAYLIPVLEAMLEQFPFQIRAFHSDNGSEYINNTVSRLLNKLLIEQTKSRPRHSNDNGLVETKNGAVVRKHMGYGHIAAPHAEAIQTFYEEHFNSYLNFHRPCGVPELITNAKGKTKRVYRWYATPWEILRRLPGLAGHLKPNVTVEALERAARSMTDTAAAIAMQTAKCKLFAGFSQRRSA